jgi:tyrosine aminotransferase
VRKYKLNPDKDWEIDIEELNRLLDQNTKFLFVINPSNPCGSVFSREHVNDIVTWAEKHCILIVADEVYYGLSFT